LDIVDDGDEVDVVLMVVGVKEMAGWHATNWTNGDDTNTVATTTTTTTHSPHNKTHNTFLQIA